MTQELTIFICKSYALQKKEKKETKFVKDFNKLWLKSKCNYACKCDNTSAGQPHYISSLKPLILFTNPSAQAGYNTTSISKQSLTGLNSESSFS